MKVVVRADGSTEIGYGHLVRTGALAEELLAKGHDVTYATETPEGVREVCPQEVRTLRIADGAEPAALLDTVEDVVDAVVIDSYHTDADYQRTVQKRFPLALISDDARYPLYADLVVNGNLYAEDVDYEVRSPEPVWCLGPDYLLLQEPIATLAQRDPPWRQEPRRAIVTMGGSDVAHLTPTVVRAFENSNLQVDAIVGPGVSERREERIRKAAADIDTDVRVDRDPPDLAKRLFEADLGVCTASSTVYECLALGTPIACLPVVENQEPIAEALRSADAATVLDRDADRPAFRAAIDRYCRDPDLRRERRQRGQVLVDGEGTRRVCAELLSLPDRNWPR